MSHGTPVETHESPEPSEREPSTAEEGPIHGVTVRSVVIGLAFTAAIAFVTPYSDLLVRGSWMACSHLPMAPLLVLMFMLTAVNTLFCRIAPRASLTHAELMTAYIIMLVGALLPSFGLAAYLIPTIAGVNYFASPENRWDSIFFHYIKPWLVPFDPAGGPKQPAVKQFYEGIHPYEPIPWGIWVRPLLVWSLFAFALFFVWMCLATILRRQWVDREKLAFPLVQLPIEMARTDSVPTAANAFFRNKFMWAGFAIPVLIHSLNSLHIYFPSAPSLTLNLPLNQFFPAMPWNAMGPFMMLTHFAVIGFSFLLSADLSFSLWFFFLLFKAQEVLAAALGMEPQYMPNYHTQSFAAYQMLGGFLVFFGYMLYLSRRQMREVVRKAFSGDDSVEDASEPLSYRTALLGLIFGTLFLSAWCTMAGMSFPTALISMLIFYLIAITLARFVAEGGLLFIQAPFRPTDLMASAVGIGAVGPANLTALAFVERIFIFDLRGFLMPSLMDGFRLSDAARIKRRVLTLTMAFSIVLATVISCATVIWIAYRRGGGVNLLGWFLTGSPFTQFNVLAQQIASPGPRDWSGAAFTSVGALVTLFISYMRVRFTWWPFHPIGYAMGPSWPMIQLWFSIMVGWLMKTLILRYGGMRGFARARPFFLGLVLGEFTVAGLWLVIDAFTGIKDHRIFLT